MMSGVTTTEHHLSAAEIADFLSDANLAEGRRLRGTIPTTPTASGKFETLDNGFGGTTTRRTAPVATVRNIHRQHRAQPAAQAADTAPRMTEKQQALIKKLVAERPGIADVLTIKESLNQAHAAGALTIKVASAAIAALLAISKPAITSPAIQLEHGRVYATVEGDFVKVAESKSGRFYGKLWINGEWVQTPSIINRIVRQLTAEEAAAWGHEHHKCVFCSRNLSDEKDGRSVKVGYGPVCADKYGLPWG